ncbi:type I DNA topoisomerase [Mucilaginibacter phyllosphaerae]|uniref:DNA topoisomerase 1 n=1 Tax=Mucilaginibacter phyllosphaerae TaxID=1812349 RepID=A0A4Y8AJT9_9SPHI|nr:type I DNA topoisomerase [Mucilaginibacter phyllosphaerae]MBB3968223.1 DNA topoisomerase-1 [Mucilaginibacter phyllosphaerae]TEW68769.1 type I DNA topoisomerase [Mucilaginibacter phyllosphaerae]GGH00405.1 DNA topoisomerase 1 [Mucilaginibacter phyllosphaerae]
MAKNLLIVESPAKAKTIEGYLGKDFTVKSSYGHIRDLVKSEDAIDINNNFNQKYEVPADKKQVVSELKKLAKEADIVWLASDEDREGEAISWHLFETLGLKEPDTRRIVFHEITKPAIMRAIENPRKIDYNLVNAQQARRVLDRLVGFELSPVLWKKVKPSLSAGRVQSVAVRLIVDREREVNKFTAEAAFKVVALFGTGRNAFKAELPERFSKQEDAEKFLQDCVKAIFEIKSLETRPTKRSPAAPFTTSTLQQEASRKLGYSVARTMQVAQRLYESGYITYMRTDSVNLSDTALNAAEKEITSAYGEKYHQHRKYKTKNASAQEAHEAIRPTYFNNHTIDGESNEKRLYELIWKRAIASQMSEAQFEKTVAKISISTRKEDLVANGEVMKFDGFLKVYLESNDDEEDNQTADGENAILPPLTKGQVLDLQELSATERFSRPPARYTEASLVKKLEELGIGRPSTYAPTISTIQNRGYVVKEEREGRQRNFRVMTLKGDNISKETKTENTGAERGKLFPTDIGAVVNDFLVQHFKGIVDFNFTAGVEKQFDEIAQGLQDWTKMIRTFYDPFHKDVQNTIETADKATGERELGVHPESSKKMSVRIGRYGPFVQVGENPSDESEEKPLYASLRTGQSIETISLEEALELFKLPKVLGEYEGKVMKVAIGRFGPYISHNSAFVSVPKEIDPLDVTQEQAIELIEAKRKKDAEKLIKSFPEDETVKVLNGRWGPYIEFGKLNVKIPKDITDPTTLTYEQCKTLADAAPKEAKKGRFGKSAAAAKPAVKKAPAKKKAVAKKK